MRSLLFIYLFFILHFVISETCNNGTIVNNKCLCKTSYYGDKCNKYNGDCILKNSDLCFNHNFQVNKFNIKHGILIFNVSNDMYENREYTTLYLKNNTNDYCNYPINNIEGNKWYKKIESRKEYWLASLNLNDTLKYCDWEKVNSTKDGDINYDIYTNKLHIKTKDILYSKLNEIKIVRYLESEIPIKIRFQKNIKISSPISYNNDIVSEAFLSNTIFRNKKLVFDLITQSSNPYILNYNKTISSNGLLIYNINKTILSCDDNYCLENHNFVFSLDNTNICKLNHEIDIKFLVDCKNIGVCSMSYSKLNL
jgi:hypothetical protein